MGKRNLSDRVKKELCAKSGNRCAFPGCPNNLYSSEASVGEICHIEGLNPGAARYNQVFAILLLVPLPSSRELQTLFPCIGSRTQYCPPSTPDSLQNHTALPSSHRKGRMLPLIPAILLSLCSRILSNQYSNLGKVHQSFAP